MKSTIFTLLISFILFSCSEKNKTEEMSEEKDGMHITVHDDSTDADVKISADGIHVKTNDGKEADVKIDAGGNMNIRTKEGDASVKMDKSGNMQITGPDGKVIDVKIPTDGK